MVLDSCLTPINLDKSKLEAFCLGLFLCHLTLSASVLVESLERTGKFILSEEAMVELVVVDLLFVFF